MGVGAEAAVKAGHSSLCLGGAVVTTFLVSVALLGGSDATTAATVATAPAGPQFSV